MYALLLAALAVVLSGLAPRVMARLVSFRRSPRAALVAWQAVSLAAVLAALCAAPAAVPYLDGPGWWACTDDCAAALAWAETRRWLVVGTAGAVTLAMVSRPSTCGSKPPSRKTGSRRVYQSVVATRLISSRCCSAEIPPPTTATRMPVNCSAHT